MILAFVDWNNVKLRKIYLCILTGTYKDGVSPKGYVLSDHMLLGSVVATILVIVVTVQIALDTSYWTVFNHIMVWGSLIWYFILDYFYNFVIGGSYVGSLTMVRIITESTSISLKQFDMFDFVCFPGHVGGDVLVHHGDIVYNSRDTGTVVAILLHGRQTDVV